MRTKIKVVVFVLIALGLMGRCAYYDVYCSDGFHPKRSVERCREMPILLPPWMDKSDKY